MKRFVTHYPLGFSLIILAIHMLIDPHSGLSQLLPLNLLQLHIADYTHIPAYLSPNCLLPTYLAVNSLIALALVAALRWCETGLLSPISWKQSYLLGLPIVLAIWPLLLIPVNIAAQEAVFVLISALLTALIRELLYRGAILGLLLPGGKQRACLLSAALGVGFYLPLLNNSPLLLRDDSPYLIVLLVTIFSTGLSFAALRLRLNSVWPLVAVQTLATMTLLSIDLAQLSWPLAIVGILLPYGLLASYGWYLLRDEQQPELALFPALLKHE